MFEKVLHNPRGGLSVAIRVVGESHPAIGVGIIHEFFHICDDIVLSRADQSHCAGFNGFGAFRRFPGD
jgi:hypothetical protein